MGKRLFFPKGIMTQSQEATEKAFLYNATIGIAIEKGKPMGMENVFKYFSHLEKSDVFSYAPSYGLKMLRQMWEKRMRTFSASLEKSIFSLPVVTTGLTHGISLVAEMFLNENETLILPNQIWGNYRLIFNIRLGIKFSLFPFFDNEGFNLKAFEETLEEEAKKNETNSLKILLNFPNNPTGYSLTCKEEDALVAILKRQTDKKRKILVILDDAYFGLTYKSNASKESLFARLHNLSNHLLCVKICGVSKEFFAWGMRIGFVTYGIKDGKNALYEALEKKTGGAVRGNISNSAKTSQSIFLKLLSSNDYKKDFEKNYNLLKDRYLEMKKVLSQNNYSNMFVPYPFNAGYFMLVRLAEHLDAESVRLRLLETEGIGGISTSKSEVRIAFSCLEKNHIKILFDKFYKVCTSF